ncbi:MAG: GNAT family N-acetyltransferase [Bacteroidota bacterium]
MSTGLQVIRYTEDRKPQWDQFLAASNMDSILLYRSFMDYHKDRFTDFSVMVLSDNEVVAVFPANVVDTVLHSHQGLTFGGLILRSWEKTASTLRILHDLLAFLQEQGITEIRWKQSPVFYFNRPSDAVEYGIFLAGGTLSRMDLAYAVDPKHLESQKIQERRRRAIKKARQQQVVVAESEGFDSFWNEVLSPNLMQRFGVNPVHSLEEIKRLAADNPGKIRQFTATLNGEVLAGATMFVSGTVAHAQYISASDLGRDNGAIDLLFYELITNYFAGYQLFDFGIANEEQGRKINKGLMDWKEGFSSLPYAHRFYTIPTSGYPAILHAL